MKNGGTCDWPGCDQDAVEEDMKTGAERCALRAGYKEGRMADNRPLGHGMSYGGQQIRKSTFEFPSELVRYSYRKPLPSAAMMGLPNSYHAQAQQARRTSVDAHNRALAMGAKWDGMDGYDFTVDEARGLPHHVGMDFGRGDSWTIMEWTRDAQGNLQVRHISEAELRGGRVEDCGNQYTGGQDF